MEGKFKTKKLIAKWSVNDFCKILFLENHNTAIGNLLYFMVLCTYYLAVVFKGIDHCTNIAPPLHYNNLFILPWPRSLYGYSVLGYSHQYEFFQIFSSFLSILQL